MKPIGPTVDWRWACWPGHSRIFRTRQAPRPTAKARESSSPARGCWATGAGWPRSTRSGSQVACSSSDKSRLLGNHVLQHHRSRQTPRPHYLPGLSFGRSEDDEQDGRRGDVLAVRYVWRSLERGPTERTDVLGTTTIVPPTSTQGVTDRSSAIRSSALSRNLAASDAMSCSPVACRRGTRRSSAVMSSSKSSIMR